MAAKTDREREGIQIRPLRSKETRQALKNDVVLATGNPQEEKKGRRQRNLNMVQLDKNFDGWVRQTTETPDIGDINPAHPHKTATMFDIRKKFKRGSGK